MALTLVPDLPTLATYDDHDIAWAPWRHTPRLSCMPNDGCASCASVADDYISHGIAQPHTGQTVTTDVVRSSGRHPGRSWTRPGRVSAWPVLRLIAFACPACARVDIYDIGTGQDEFVRVDHRPTR